MIYINLGGVELQEANEVWRESAALRPNEQACALQSGTKLVHAVKHDSIIVPSPMLKKCASRHHKTNVFREREHEVI